MNYAARCPHSEIDCGSTRKILQYPWPYELPSSKILPVDGNGTKISYIWAKCSELLSFTLNVLFILSTVFKVYFYISSGISILMWRLNTAFIS